MKLIEIKLIRAEDRWQAALFFLGKKVFHKNISTYDIALMAKDLELEDFYKPEETYQEYVNRQLSRMMKAYANFIMPPDPFLEMLLKRKGD
jgi:hypothetical protein